MRDWTCLPPWSARAVALIALGLLALAALRWRRERRGRGPAVLRAVIVAALALVMLNPTALLPRQHPEKPKLIVLLDTSESMATRDVGGRSRLELALASLNAPATLAMLNRQFSLDTRRFDRQTQPADFSKLTNATLGDATDIGSALLAAVTELGDAKSQAGVLLISDGRETTPGAIDAAKMALARSVPVWTWTVGGSIPRHDVWLETAASETLAFGGADVDLVATLHEAGYDNRSFVVQLLRDDKQIDSKEVVPDASGLARVSCRVQAPETGEHRYVFRVPPQPEEADTNNNERAIFVRSVGGKVRVLQAEGQPHWDTKFLVQSLERDPHVDLTAVYRLNAQRYIAILSQAGVESRVETDLFPRTAAEMSAFDIIVLGRGTEAFFDARTEQLLTDFVSRGGNLVFARGKPYDGHFEPLAKLEPLAWGEGATSAVRLRVTEAGRDNPIFDLGVSGNLNELMERLPALESASVTLGEKPLAVVLATAAAANADSPALLAYQRYGQGKVLSLNAEGLWRWDFRETGQQESEVAYQRFWVSTLQWLLAGGQFLPGADVSLTSARRYYTSDEPMQFLIATRNIDRALYRPKLTITGAKSSVVEPRAKGEMFMAEAGPFPPGSYIVTLTNSLGHPAELSQTIEVISASLEKRDLSADAEMMGKIAEVSGGATLHVGDVARLPEIVRQWETARQLAYRQETMWDRWPVLAGILGLMGAEWWWRRREGLL